MPPGGSHIVLTMLSAGLLAWTATASAARAQASNVTVLFRGEPSRTTTIGAIERQGTVFGSLADIASVFSLSLKRSDDAPKAEISGSPYRVKITGQSPFVILLDAANRQTIHQLPHDVQHAGGLLFIPMEDFAPLFASLLGSQTRFDRDSRTLSILGPVPAGYDIPTVELEQKANGMLVRIRSAKRFIDYEAWLKQDGWLYVTIAGARADTAAINSIPAKGLVRRIVAIQSPTSVQLTLRLTGTIEATELIPDPGSNDLLLTIRPAPRPPQSDLSEQRKRWKLDVIVLDAGHGGHDPGATGATGTREKDVTLGITLKLGKLIERNLKDIKVVYTRKDDRFVELYRRGQIANEADGKLFISIHCNSMPRKPNPTRGFEVYLLRPGKTEEAVAIAERENAVIELEQGTKDRYQELTEENFILVAMAQSAYVRSSETFADLTQQELDKTTELPNRGVKQAGFYVLVGAAMPNILIETGYLSNRADEKYLRSQAGQQHVAESIFSAIKRYKQEYERLLLEGKEIGGM
jgi:N-acetylmuramoyl-L-alanine amidase